MPIIARKPLIDFSQKHPDSSEPLKRWWKICSKNSFLSFNDLKKTFGAADIVHKCIIFNIGGGKYRMIVRINFPAQRMWIKYIVTHEKYNRMNLLEDPKCLP